MRERGGFFGIRKVEDTMDDPSPLIRAAMVADVPARATQETAVANDVRLRRARLSTGVTLEVAESGVAAADPVLFLHGLTDSWFSFSRVIGRLPTQVRAIVPSQRGHGD